MLHLLKALIADENGATVLEYGLIAALVAVAIVATLTAVGVSLAGFLGFASDHLEKAAQNTPLNP